MKHLIVLIFLLLIGSCKEKETRNNIQQDKLPIELSAIKTILDSIYLEDQKYRREENIKGDSSNLVVVEQILSDYGWLSSEQIGKTANSTFFFVIQHASQEIREKYLPMMRDAVREGKADARHLALLEDRVALFNGELQIYGSQIGTDYETGKLYVRPLIDPDKVNERRREVGLDSIENYISNWNLEWDVEEYKKELPKWREMLKK